MDAVPASTPVASASARATQDTGSWTQTADRLAIVLSAACAVHCALTPVLLAVLPFLGSAAFENVLRLLLSSLGVVAIGFGAVIHRSLRSVPYLVVALGIFGWLAFAHGGVAHGEVPHEELVSVIGSLFLMGGHWRNLRTAREACSQHTHRPSFWSAKKNPGR